MSRISEIISSIACCAMWGSVVYTPCYAQTDVHQGEDGTQQELVERTELNFEEQRPDVSQAVTQLEHLSGLLRGIENRLEDLQEPVLQLRTEQGICRESLEAARNALKAGAPYADLLYARALRYTPEKMDILLEYVDARLISWNQQLQASPLAEYATLQQELTRLKSFCNESLAESSPADILRFEELRERLVGADAALSARRRDGALELSGLKSRVSELSAAELEENWKIYSKLEACPEWEEEQLALLAALEMWRSCYTSHTAPLVLPSLTGDPVPWDKWLANFKGRLEDESISLKSRIEDYHNAEHVLKAAGRTNDTQTVQDLLREIAACGDKMQAADWLSQAETASSIAEKEEMLLQSKMLTASQQEMIAGCRQKLRQQVCDVRLTELRHEWNALRSSTRSLESRLNCCFRHRVKSSQMLLNLAEIIEETHLADFKSFVQNQDAHSSQLMKLLQLEVDIQAKELVLQELQSEQDNWNAAKMFFLKVATSLIKDSESRLQKIDEEFWFWERNEKKAACKSVYLNVKSLNEADLNYVSPGLYDRYKKLVENLEDRYDDLGGPSKTISIHNYLKK